MPRSAVLALCLVALSYLPALAQSPPAEIGGFVLGDDAATHRDRLSPRGPRSVPGAPYVKRLNIKPGGGFQSGYVIVGDCAAKGRIARIKLRYADASLEAFQKLAGAFLARFGDPAEYKGDLKGRVMGNKWSFTNERGESISLALTHGDVEDAGADKGNVVKLTNWGFMETELGCLAARPGKGGAPRPAVEVFEDLLPR